MLFKSQGRGILRVVELMQRGVVQFFSLLVFPIGFLLLLLAGSIAQVFLFALYLLAFIPPLRNFVVRVQLYLSGWLGDAYLVAASPVRYSSMVSQVKRDIDWLLNKQPNRGACQRVAVIAHSGGTIISHRALTGPQSEKYRQDSDRSPLLITYGSGHSKEETIRQVWRIQGFLFAASQIARVYGR